MGLIKGHLTHPGLVFDHGLLPYIEYITDFGGMVLTKIWTAEPILFG